MQCGSHDSIGSLPRADSAWLVRVGLDNARISSRISASRSGGSGDMLIYVRDAADLKLCLLLRSFFADEGRNPDYSRASDHSTLHARESLPAAGNLSWLVSVALDLCVKTNNEN